MAQDIFSNWFSRPVRPHVIVVGNEKGGSGKSTTAMLLVVNLLKQGHAVGSIDLDARQGTLSHYILNRTRCAEITGRHLEMPEHRRVHPPADDSTLKPDHDATLQFAKAIEGLMDRAYIVIDTPGNNTFLSRVGHLIGDTLITPLNDSFLDLDVLVRMDMEGRRIIGPSVYSQTITERSARRMALGGEPPDWIVMRNRMAHLDSRNQRQVEQVLEQLASRIGFRLAHGLTERVIYRELFTKGLTVLDLPELPVQQMNPSHAGAREEVSNLFRALKLPVLPLGLRKEASL